MKQAVSHNRLPDHTTTRMSYGFGADRTGATQFLTTVTDANNKQKKSYRDVRELITTVTEYNKGQTLYTSYRYDALKQITAVLDDKNNLTQIKYDNLGRRTMIDNPDTGKTETVYDLASNPVQKITAVLKLQNKAIHYDYDQNRLIAVHYPNNPGNDVSYTYGGNTPQAKQYNQVGRVVKITSQAGVEERRYGKLGETVQETKTVSSHTQGNSPNSPEVYTTQYDFDTFGRLMLLTLPDGEIITHRYDSGGNVEHIEGARNGQTTAYLTSLLYDKFEQRTDLTLGNGIATHYTYNDKNRRLDNLNSSGNLAGHFQNLDYKYDKVGNITQLINDVAIPPPNSFGGPTSQTFGYDDLYRLTSASGSFKSSPNKVRQYKLGMAYDSIHNITQKTQTDTLTSGTNKGIPQKGTTYDWTYTYTGAQPHAPGHIGERTFYYDANGNQTGWDNDNNGTKRTLTWDEDNRIQSIADNGSTTDFKYDDQGQRVFKIGKQGETVYINQFFTVRNRSIVSKHVFAGTSRLATKLETGNGNTDIRNPGTGTSGQPKPNNGQGNAYAYGHDKDKRGNAYGLDKDKQGNAFGHDKDKTKSTQLNPLPPGEGRVGEQGASATTAIEPTVAAGSTQTVEAGKASAEVGNLVVTETAGVALDAAPIDTSASTSGQSPTKFLYYYHPDHLGSTGYVTDADGKLYEHIEYFPFGETWVQQSSNTQRTPYLFTGKELDEETQLYYYGARYYDPRTSVWQSADPILEKYLPNRLDPAQPKDSFNPEHDLAGMGGVYNSLNLGLYSYGHQNPVKLLDPDGRRVVFDAGADPQFKKDFAAAVKYLNQNKASGDLARLEKSKNTYTIKYQKNGGTFNPASRTIGWDPKMGVKTTNDKKLSPASVLMHEATHGTGYESNPEKYLKDVRTSTGDKYDNMEEKRVITGSEQDVARKLGEINKGEITRTDHRGERYDTKGPTTTEEQK